MSVEAITAPVAERQINTTEPTAIKEAAPIAEDGQLSPKFAALAKKERFLRSKYASKDSELKAREEALKAKEAEYSTSYLSKSALAEKAKVDPLGVLGEMGLTPDEFTQYLLNSSPQDTLIRKLQSEVQELRETQNKTLSKFDEQQKKAYDQAVSQIRNDTKLLIDSDQSYELIKETDSVEAVVQLIEETFKEEGKLMSVEQAAVEVENYLLEKSSKLAQLKKVQDKLKPQVPEAPEVPQKLNTQQQKLTVNKRDPETEKPRPQVSLTTLTNAATATPTKPLSERERIQRAILAFQGKLNT
jgi:hypothetical protein